MLEKENSKEELATLITEMNELLNEIKEEQQNLKKDVAQNHKVNMQKFAKLLEYDEICDMTNTIFERRLASIEKLLYDVFKS